MFAFTGNRLFQCVRFHRGKLAGSQESVENPGAVELEEVRCGLFSGQEALDIARWSEVSSGPGSSGNKALRTIPGVEAVTPGQSSEARGAGLEGRDPLHSSETARPA